MGGYVLVADGVERRVRERAEQLALDGWPVRGALRPHDARELLSGAEVLVVGMLATISKRSGHLYFATPRASRCC